MLLKRRVDDKWSALKSQGPRPMTNAFARILILGHVETADLRFNRVAMNLTVAGGCVLQRSRIHVADSDFERAGPGRDVLRAVQ